MRFGRRGKGSTAEELKVRQKIAGVAESQRIGVEER